MSIVKSPYWPVRMHRNCHVTSAARGVPTLPAALLDTRMVSSVGPPINSIKYILFIRLVYIVMSKICLQNKINGRKSLKKYILYIL